MNRTWKWSAPTGAFVAAMLLGLTPVAAEEEAAPAEAEVAEQADEEAAPAEAEVAEATEEDAEAEEGEEADEAEVAEEGAAPAEAEVADEVAEAVEEAAAPVEAEVAEAVEAVEEAAAPVVSEGAEVAGAGEETAALDKAEVAKKGVDEITADPVDPTSEALDDELDAVLEDETAVAGKPWSVSASLRTVVGQGTFVDLAEDSEWADQVQSGEDAYDRVSMGVSVGASYRLSDFSFSLGTGWTQWLTPGGPGWANKPYESRLGDTSLSAGWKGYTVEAIGLNITPGLEFTLPTSRTSRVSTLYTDVSGSVSLSRSFFERLTLSYSLGGSKAFHKYKSPVLDLDDIGIENAIYRTGGAEAVAPGRFAIEGYNTEYALSNSFRANVKIWDTLSGSISWGLTNYWAYAFEGETPDNFHVPDYAREGIRGRYQLSSGSVSLSYGINNYLSASLAASSMQPPKTDDQQSFRFPFWNFNGAARNLSSISFALSGSY